jgi:hypothetical protein
MDSQPRPTASRAPAVGTPSDRTYTHRPPSPSRSRGGAAEDFGRLQRRVKTLSQYLT